MFTGIVEARGQVRKIEGTSNKKLTISKPSSWKLKIGGSVALDGVCVTVTASTGTSFSCEIVPETLRRSTLNAVAVGRVVNLERPLKLGDELGGHLMLGHVDGRARVTKVEKAGASREVTLHLPARLERDVDLKGSVALNGVSLTVAKKRGRSITVALIPHTLSSTNLSDVLRGDVLNIEVDHLARSMAALRRR